MLIFIAGIIGIIVLLVGITIINTTGHTKKFRFENFKTAEELIEYIKTNYPNGTDGKSLIELLENSGAKCKIIPERYYSKNDKTMKPFYLYNCRYHTGWISLYPLTNYSVTLGLDEQEKVIYFSVGRHEGF